MLAASQLGAQVPLACDAVSPAVWGRVATLAVVGFGSRRAAVATGCWILVAVGAHQTAAGITVRLDARPPAVAARPWTPSAWCESEQVAVLRTRARPRLAASGRWSAPATVLRAEPPAGRDARAASAQDTEVLLRGDGAPPPAGALVLAAVALRPPGRAAVPGGFDAAAWLAGRGITATASVIRGHEAARLGGGGLPARVGSLRDRLQGALRARLAAGLPPREQAVAGGVLLGGGTAGALRDPFARLGLAHVFALSGLHVGILAGLALLALRPLGAGPLPRLVLLAPALGAYVILVDLPGSVVRAAGLVILLLLGPVAGRRLDSLRLLGLLLWANLLWQPAALMDVGTRLSYQAAGGIVAGQRILVARRRGSSPRYGRLVSAMGVTVSAQLATLPEVARAFGFLPLVGPLANLLLVPVFGAAVTLLASGLALGLAWPWAGDGVLAVAWLLLRLLAAATAAAAGAGAGLELGLPAWGAARSVAYAILLVALVSVLRQRRRRTWLVAGLVYLSLMGVAGWRPPAGGAVEAWQFAVGQGDAALLRFPDGWTCLVDTGERWRSGDGPLAREVLPFLRRQGIRRLDAVVLTHGHADHTGGAEALAADLPVGAWFTGGEARPGPSLHLRPTAGDTLHAAAGWALVCLHPADPAAADQAENDRSVVLGLCRAGRLHGLWTGDLERAGERALLPRLPAVPEEGLDLLKAGHHGSATSAGPDLLEVLRPRLVAVSCGIANRHGHPSHGPYVAAAGTLAVARTDLQGTLHLRWDGRGRFRARAMRPLPPASLDTP